MASTYKRGKTWWGRVWRAGREVRRSLETTDKSLAQKRLNEWVAQMDRAAWGEKPFRSFLEAAEKFAAEHCTTLKPRSAQRYAVSLVHLIDSIGGKALAEISSADLSAFETKRRTDGVSAPTIRRDLACLSSLFGCAMEWEWVDVNPVPAYMNRRKRKGLKESPPETRWLTHKEEAAVLKAATPDPARAISFAIDSGLRLEEQFSLKWSQVDFDQQRLVIIGKGGKRREVPFIGRVGTILRTMPRHIKSPYVFWHDGGRRYNNMEKGFKAAARRAKVKDVSWHDLRRTFGCRRLQDDGLKMEQVSLLLGHSSVTVTERIYAFLTIDSVERSLNSAQNREHKTADNMAKDNENKAMSK